MAIGANLGRPSEEDVHRNTKSVPVAVSPFVELSEAWARIEHVAKQVDELADRFVGPPATGELRAESPRGFDGLAGSLESTARGLQQQADQMEQSLHRIRRALP